MPGSARLGAHTWCGGRCATVTTDTEISVQTVSRFCGSKPRCTASGPPHKLQGPVRNKEPGPSFANY